MSEEQVEHELGEELEAAESAIADLFQAIGGPDVDLTSVDFGEELAQDDDSSTADDPVEVPEPEPEPVALPDVTPCRIVLYRYGKELHPAIVLQAHEAATVDLEVFGDLPPKVKFPKGVAWGDEEGCWSWPR